MDDPYGFSKINNMQKKYDDFMRKDDSSVDELEVFKKDIEKDIEEISKELFYQKLPDTSFPTKSLMEQKNPTSDEEFKKITSTMIKNLTDKIQKKQPQ